MQGDVSRQADVKRLFAETTKAFGAVDVLVNNAGVYAFQSIEDVTEADIPPRSSTSMCSGLCSRPRRRLRISAVRAAASST